jgi:hypothetical protein
MRAGFWIYLRNQKHNQTLILGLVVLSKQIAAFLVLHGWAWLGMVGWAFALRL